MAYGKNACSSHPLNHCLCHQQEIRQTHRYIQKRSQNLRHFYIGMGLNLGVFRFPCNQSKCGSSGAYATCNYCSQRVTINTCKMLHRAWRSWKHFFAFAFAFDFVVFKNPRTTVWAPCASDYTIAQVIIQSLEFPMYICGQTNVRIRIVFSTSIFSLNVAVS